MGRGLFEWGSDDGDRGTARLQHPLGVAALTDGSIAVADTFNSLIRVWDGARLRTLRLSEAVDEPGGIDVLLDGRLLVADINRHRVVTVDIATGAVAGIPIPGQRQGAAPPGEALSAGAGDTIHLSATVDLDGMDLDLQQGPPVHVNVTADPPVLLGPGPRSWALDSLPVEVEVRLGRRGTGVLIVDIIASTCEGDVCTVKRATREHALTVQ